MIYLDYNATAPLRAEAVAAMRAAAAESFGNATSVHQSGRSARTVVEACRRALAETIGAEANEVFFTSGGTESNNLALFGAAPEWRGRHLVVSPIEHSSIVESVRELERRGANVTWLPVDGMGRIAPQAVAAALSEETALVSLGWANNEIGTIQAVTEVAEICHSRNVPLHVDAVQALGKVPVAMRGLTLCSVSAHKIGGPQGGGALFVRRGFDLRPMLFGGAQERGLRPGTENVAGLAGFAAVLAAGCRDARSLVTLRERLWGGLAELDGVRRNSPVEDCLPNTLHVSFADLRGESLVAALDLEGIAVSVGSACAAGSAEPSHVLLAIGRNAHEAAEGVRFSLGEATTVEEIDTTLAAVRAVVAHMRGTSHEPTRELAQRAREQQVL
jgi:cysteine desulfurase